jgi:TonB family protein
MTLRSLVALVLALAALAGCGRGRAREQRPVRLPVSVFSDTARSVRFAAPPPDPAVAATPSPAPAATVWLARVSPAQAALPEVPSAPPESLSVPWPAPPTLALDDDLKPPIPRGAARLRVPAGARPGWVELDVRVDEHGAVTDAEWAGGSQDTALVRAATDCAHAMRFYPAVQSGREVAVWCRQRFDFGRD